MNERGSPVTPCSCCGTLLSEAVLGGLCPRCLTRAVFFSTQPAPLEEADLPVASERLGDYELLERIARGGMGIVYRARQISLRREVAVKVLLDPAFASPEELGRFRAEAAAAAALHHPHIVAIHEIGEADGRCFFSMDLVAGKDLAELTREGLLPPIEAAALVLKVADAIHYCHERGIVHRDLKPSNVLVDAQGEPHVTDFGLAKRMLAPQPAGGSSGNREDAPLTVTGQVVGTPGYMSPEQAAASRDVGPLSDIYSLGALLYFLLTGRAPFVGPTAAAILRQVEEQEPPAPRLLNPALPRDLETICLKCLAKEASRRYATAGELAADLGRFLGHEPIRARPTTGRERAVRWARRNPVVASLTTLVGLLLITVAVVSVFAARRQEQNRLAESGLRMEAETRLRQGERLINFMLGDLVDRLEPVGRLDVLESAISQVDQFYAQIPPDHLSPESQRHRANTLFQFGGIRSAQGRLPEAVTNYLAAIAGYAAIVSAHPTNLQWRYELSRVRNDLGIAYARQHDYTNGPAVFAQTLQEREALLALEPTNITWLTSCGATAQNLATIQRRLGQFEAAAENLQRAERAFRAWIKADPGSLSAKERLATIRGSTGQLLVSRHQPKAATEAYADQIALLHEVLKPDPHHRTRQAALVLALSYLAECQMGQSNALAALPSLKEGVLLGEELVAHDPANRDWQLCLVTHLADLGAVLDELERPEEALASLRRAWELSEAHLDTTRQYPEWFNNYRQSLELGEQLERRTATAARLKGQAEIAAGHEQAADKLGAKFRDLSK